MDGSTIVLGTSSFVLKFDRFLLPSTVIRQSVCLQADLVEVQAPGQCKRGVLLEPAYDPIRREVIYRRNAGEPRLAPGTRYRLTVLPPVDEGAAGFRAFDGAPLEGRVQLDVTVADSEPPGAQDELPPSGDLFCARDPECLSGCGGDAACEQGCERIGVEPLITSCAFGSGCHRDAYRGTTLVRGAVEGLNLETAAYIQSTAIGRVAHQTQTGEHADEGDRAPLRFGRAMPIIDPSNPGNSYLLYKIAAGPNVSGDAASAAEIQRLRGSIVVGLPMPPYSGAGSATFDVAGAALISEWIAQGAPMRDCSLPPFD